MEAFSQNNTFGKPAADAGFFTIAIWTGILLMAPVIVMLVFAIDMTYSIQTTDRFDSRSEERTLISGSREQAQLHHAKSSATSGRQPVRRRY